MLVFKGKNGSVLFSFLSFSSFVSWRRRLLLLPHWQSQVCFKEQQLEITFSLFSKKSHICAPSYFVRTLNFRQSEKQIQRWHWNLFAGKQKPPFQSTSRSGLSGGSWFWYWSFVIDLLPVAKPKVVVIVHTGPEPCAAFLAHRHTKMWALKISLLCKCK